MKKTGTGLIDTWREKIQINVACLLLISTKRT